MSPIGDIAGNQSSIVKATLTRVVAVQKPSVRSGLHKDGDETASPRDGAGDAAYSQDMHRSGTDVSVSFRNAPEEAPRLMSPFVAQLLGQIMPDPEMKLSEARAAYDRNEARSARIFDTHL